MPEQQFTPRVRRVVHDERERLQYVSSLLRERRADEARDELLAILERNNQSVPAHLMLGWFYQTRRKLPEALDHFNRAIKIDPMDARAHLLAGSCNLRVDDLAQAKSLINTALNLDPKLVGAHLAMAQVLSKEDANSEAIAHLERALDLDPQMAVARLLLARMLSREGRSEDAVEELDSLLSTNPGHLGGSVRLVLLHSQQGRHDKALELLEAALKTSPQAPLLWTISGRIKLNTKDYEGAEAAFREAIRLRPRDVTAVLGFVETLIAQRKFDQAKSLLKRIPRLGRLASAVHQYYGDVYAAEGLQNEAIESYRAALLHSTGGEASLKEAEASFGANASAAVKLKRLQTALAKQRDEARKRLADTDWEQALEQMVPQFGEQPARDRVETT
jgi:tetratricopeptide (TPR) repeat protein